MRVYGVVMSWEPLVVFRSAFGFFRTSSARWNYSTEARERFALLAAELRVLRTTAASDPFVHGALLVFQGLAASGGHVKFVITSPEGAVENKHIYIYTYINKHHTNP